MCMHDPAHPKESHISDQTLLVLLAQTGDRTALEQLLRNCHAPLRRYITRLAGADLADDILQETSIQIFRKLQFLREPAVFHAWTLRIASRIAITHLKRTHRWQTLDDLREALVDLLPERRRPARPRALVGAYLLDFLFLGMVVYSPQEVIASATGSLRLHA